eukprot:4244839-Pleurochrysis_carterae.AAC.3
MVGYVKRTDGTSSLVAGLSRRFEPVAYMRGARTFRGLRAAGQHDLHRASAEVDDPDGRLRRPGVEPVEQIVHGDPAVQALVLNKAWESAE